MKFCLETSNLLIQLITRLLYVQNLLTVNKFILQMIYLR